MQRDSRVNDLETMTCCRHEYQETVIQNSDTRPMYEYKFYFTYLPITYNVPWAASWEVKFSRGGSRVTETLSSLWYSLGGISLKDTGVEAARVLCSSGVTNVGRVVIIIAAGIFVLMLWDASRSRLSGNISRSLGTARQRLLVATAFFQQSKCS